MYKKVTVRIGFNRYKEKSQLFCDVCEKPVHWVVPQKDITSTVHICENCYKKMVNKD